MRSPLPILSLLVLTVSCINSNSPAVPTAGFADSIIFRQRMTELQKVYADPNSPYRNETEAVKLYDSILASPYYSAAEKFAVRERLQLSLQNRAGEPANDFRYYTPEGVAKNLYSIQAPYILLYFYNPECHSCKDMKAQIEASETITKNIKSGRLKLLAIYTDRDQALWRRHLPENPAQWLNGRDTAEYLWNNKIYDLRAIPTLYLLDKEKRVLLKDCMLVEEIERKLEEADSSAELHR